MTYRRLASDITRAYDTSLNELRESPDIGWRGYSGSISCERFIALSKARAASATSQAVGSAHRLRVTTRSSGDIVEVHGIQEPAFYSNTFGDRFKKTSVFFQSSAIIG